MQLLLLSLPFVLLSTGEQMDDEKSKDVKTLKDLVVTYNKLWTVKHISDKTGVQVRTLHNWHNDKPVLLKYVLDGMKAEEQNKK